MLRLHLTYAAACLHGLISFSPDVCAAGLPPFKPLRYDEDYSFLANPASRTTAWEEMKYVPLASGNAGFLSFGGEARARFEVNENEFFSQSSNADNAYLLQRYLVHVDYHPAPWVRAFGQLQSSLEDGKVGGPRPTDRDSIDLHQLFVEFIVPDRDGRLSLRLGRQEISLGSERLVSVREGPNNRRAFDAVRALYSSGRTSATAFYSSPVEIDRGAFDDQNIHGQNLWGVYATVPLPQLEHVSLDLYYLGFENSGARFYKQLAHELRHTLGVRFFGSQGALDFNYEVDYQFGEIGPAVIDAWGVATEAGVTLGDCWGKPRVALKADVATGERGSDLTSSHAGSPFFPRGNYFTEAGLLGPKNFFDAHPSVRFQPRVGWTVDAGLDFFWRQSLSDGVYSSGGAVVYPGNPTFSRFVGTDLSMVTAWQVTSRLKWAFGYTHFFSGEFVRQNHGVDVNFFNVEWTFRF